MNARVPLIASISLPLLGACSSSGDSGAGADAAADAASIDAGAADTDATATSPDAGDAAADASGTIDARASETGAEAGQPSVESPCFRNPGAEAWSDRKSTRLNSSHVK